MRLRVAARVDRREEAEAVGREVEALWIGGPYGGAGATRWRREVVAIGSVFVGRETVDPRVTLLEA